MLRIHGHLVISLVACCLLRGAPSAVADEPKQDEFTAEQLLDRMSKAYANCKTYRDSGVVTVVITTPSGKKTENKPFETAFVRPDRFRFEYSGHLMVGYGTENHYLIWSKGKDVQTWNDAKPAIEKKPGIEKTSSLYSLLATAAGVSSSSAITIPPLLMPNELQGPKAFAMGRITKMTELKRSGDAKLANVDCFRVEGKHRDKPQTLWLDKKTFLIRRIDSQLTIPPNSRAEETTTYAPVIDGEITEKMLAFDPPK